MGAASYLAEMAWGEGGTDGNAVWPSTMEDFSLGVISRAYTKTSHTTDKRSEGLGNAFQ